MHDPKIYSPGPFSRLFEQPSGIMNLTCVEPVRQLYEQCEILSAMILLRLLEDVSSMYRVCPENLKRYSPMLQCPSPMALGSGKNPHDIELRPKPTQPERDLASRKSMAEVIRRNHFNAVVLTELYRPIIGRVPLAPSICSYHVSVDYPGYHKCVIHSGRHGLIDLPHVLCRCRYPESEHACA